MKNRNAHATFAASRCSLIIRALANNIALWSDYFDQQRRAWLRLLGLQEDRTVDDITRTWADIAAAAAARAVTVVVAPWVEQLFQRNAPSVSAFIQAAEATRDVVPDTYRRRAKAERRRPSPTSRRPVHRTDPAPKGQPAKGAPSPVMDPDPAL